MRFQRSIVGLQVVEHELADGRDYLLGVRSLPSPTSTSCRVPIAFGMTA